MRTYVSWEWRRLKRTPRLWASYGALMLLGLLFSYGYLLMRHGTGLILPVGSTVRNGFFVPILALSLSVTVLLPFFVTVFSGDGISGERQLRTWDLLLANGVDPLRLYLAKWWVGWGFCIRATLILTTTSLVGGALLFGLRGSVLPSGARASAQELLAALAVMTVYTILGQGVVMTLSLSISAVMKHSASAILASMGAILTMVMMGDLPFMTSIRGIFFTSYFSRMDAVLETPPHWSSLAHGALVYAIWLFTLLAFGCWMAPRRE